MKYIIDRIENNIVICENQETKKMENFDKSMFPEQIKDGDVVIRENDTFRIDEEETENRKEFIWGLRNCSLKDTNQNKTIRIFREESQGLIKAKTQGR